ncbi:retrovirus-related pol polyprotein from transposon TNT 1-94 [Tanacetum coccineum]
MIEQYIVCKRLHIRIWDMEGEILKKRKEIVDIAAQTPSAYTIVPGMFKLDLEPLAPRLLQNRDVHIEYLKYTQEQADILWGIVEQAKAKQPLDKELNFTLVQISYFGNVDSEIFETHDREPLSAHELYLEVAFRKNTCFIRNLEGVDLLLGSRDINLYTLSLDDMLRSSLICLLSKASKTKSWLSHRRLSHLNFDNGTEFVNRTLREWYENVGITHQTSVARTPQQNGVVERQNRTLVEATRTMLIFSNAPLFLWAEAINTACYTQNRSLIRHRYNKTPYELMQDKKPDLSFFLVFGSLCYPTNDHDDLGKFDAKADIGIFVGYAPAKKAFRIYNRRTWIITETIHVTFDELKAMAYE